MRRDALFRSFSAALQCAAMAAAAATTQVFSDTADVDGFVAQLDLDHGAETHVSRLLRGYDAGRIARLGDREKASIACAIVGLVLDGSSDVITQTTPAYTDLVEVNW